MHNPVIRLKNLQAKKMFSGRMDLINTEAAKSYFFLTRELSTGPLDFSTSRNFRLKKCFRSGRRYRFLRTSVMGSASLKKSTYRLNCESRRFLNLMTRLIWSRGNGLHVSKVQPPCKPSPSHLRVEIDTQWHDHVPWELENCHVIKIGHARKTKPARSNPESMPCHDLAMPYPQDRTRKIKSQIMPSPSSQNDLVIPTPIRDVNLKRLRHCDLDFGHCDGDSDLAFGHCDLDCG